MNHVEYLLYQGVHAMNSRVVALADYRGTPRLATESKGKVAHRIDIHPSSVAGCWVCLRPAHVMREEFLCQLSGRRRSSSARTLSSRIEAFTLMRVPSSA